jgi:hypothetical protein
LGISNWDNGLTRSPAGAQASPGMRGRADLSLQTLAADRGLLVNCPGVSIALFQPKNPGISGIYDRAAGRHSFTRQRTPL